jgi:hypothetical protein
MRRLHERRRLGITVLMAHGLMAGCARSAVSPESSVRFPPDVAGYQCYRGEATVDGSVSAEGYPDYQGGLSSLTMSWQTPKSTNDNPVPEAIVVWTRGPRAIAPPGWLTVTQTVRYLPPLHTKVKLTLSSGETIEQDFLEPRRWREWKRTGERWDGFGGQVHTQSADFIGKFTAAAWAEVVVVAPDSAIHARERIDLSTLADSLALMRALGTEVEADVADYEHRCRPLYIETHDASRD